MDDPYLLPLTSRKFCGIRSPTGVPCPHPRMDGRFSCCQPSHIMLTFRHRNDAPWPWESGPHEASEQWDFYLTGADLAALEYVCPSLRISLWMPDATIIGMSRTGETSATRRVSMSTS